MRIQTFRAESIQEALQLVREELGPDASIIGSRQVRGGWFSKRLIEIEASRDLALPSRLPHRSQPATSSRLGGRQRVTADSAGDRTASVNPRAGESPARGDLPLGLPASTTVLEPLNWPAARPVLAELLDIGVERALAHELIRLAIGRCDQGFQDDEWLIRGQINELVAQRMWVAEHRQPPANDQRVIALVGPPGSGKTSTLGKLAHRAYFEDGLQVGVLDFDTWREGGVEQLLRDAELVSAQVEVVGKQEHLLSALQRLCECDVVLMDTAGRSPQVERHLDQLQEFLRIAQPDEVHLVVGADCSATDFQSVVDSFAVLKPTHLAITRWDAVTRAGQWLGPLWQRPLPVSLLTHGEQAGADLMLTNPRRLAAVLLVSSSSAPAASP